MMLVTATRLKLVLAVVCALALALLVAERNRWKATASLRHQQLLAEKAAHGATVANYRAAAERARAADLANAAQVKAQQEAINERTVDDYEARIAAARARSRGLQRQANSAAAGAGTGGATHLPRLPAAAGRAAEAAGENGLRGADALIATEQAIQLDELIKWVRRQHQVPVDQVR